MSNIINIQITELNDNVNVNVNDLTEVVNIQISDVGVKGDKGDGARINYLTLPVATNGQTNFSVFQQITESTLNINGLDYYQNESYTISFNNPNWELVWIENIQLETTDLLILNF